MTAPRTIFAHILLYDSGPAGPCKLIDSLLAQSGIESDPASLIIQVSENGRDRSALSAIRERFGTRVSVRHNPVNLGFCAGHNLAAAEFIASGCGYLLVLNPDLVMAPDACRKMLDAFEVDASVGAVTPKLLRSDENLIPLQPPVFDAAGMIMTAALRHFDRGSGEPDRGQYDNPALIFGGTGACLMLSRDFVQQAALAGERFDSDLYRVYPQLKEGAATRLPLFDEAFFAYRDDADLAWRANLLGWRYRYEPRAVGWHVRVVTPERRSALPALLNRLGVRNRFLLQLNNPWPLTHWAILLHGFILRNLIVLAAVLLRERSSLSALAEVVKLTRRALERRELLMKRAKTPPREVVRMFSGI